ncbi:uncharacterized protein LOC129757912 [Uranotaenia lowii]|uniref:uncharacterized protein LOC129757912 n=1 Tax=Uranotaenia lowii TaxID=190385 RepID=UPI00247AC506|nr:uncharacterized protein LOC129757912 [Uranotaenia lowii]
MEKLISRRNSVLVQLKGELSAAEAIHDRMASRSEALDRLEQLKELAGKFRNTQSEIEENQTDPEVLASVHDVRKEFSDLYYRAKDNLESYIVDCEIRNSEVRSTTSERGLSETCGDLKQAMQLLMETQRQMMMQQNEQRAHLQQATSQVSNTAPLINVKLPSISVPTFSGERKHWRSFKDIYETTIHSRNDLRDSLKMQYLISYLEGDAKRMVSSFPISDANYMEAWEALTSFYDKKKYTVFALVREFVDQPAVSATTPQSLRKLVATSDDVVRQLNALGAEYNTRDPWLIHLVLEKLDKETRSLWAQRITEVENPSFEQFLEFLDNRCDALETCTAFSRMEVTTGKKEFEKKQFQGGRKVQTLHTTATENKQKCAKCSSEHPIYQCSDFKNMNLKSKRELVQKERLCYNCLRNSHTVKQCQSKSVCRTADCKQRHHTLLCPSNSVPDQAPSGDSKQLLKNPEENNVVNINVAQVPVSPRRIVGVLPTAIVRVQGFDGNFHQARALIDSGSQASLISEICVNKLRLPRTNAKVVVSGIGQQPAGTSRGLVKLSVASRFNNTIVLRTCAVVLGKLTSTLPAQHLKVNPSLLCEQIQQSLADPGFNQPGPIDIILGSDVFLALLEAGQVKDECGVPVAQNTIFGWIVSGNQGIQADLQVNFSIVNLHTDLDINQTLRQFWEQEEVPKAKQLTSSEQKAVDYFRSTLSRDESGRFIVRLPFDDSKPALGESLTAAVRRLRSMEKRFRQNQEFHKQYSEFLREYLALNHMEEVPADEVSVETSKCFYLPHHAVVKTESTTTKLRVVFDASSASSTGVSLNDKLLAGPNVNQELFDVFLRFRTKQVAFTADVEKMYRQVLVHEADRDFQRIVWRESEEEPIKHYRLRTVTYGTKSAPFLAIESMKEAARKYKEVYPEAAEQVELGTYVDDLLSGSQSVDGAKGLKEQLVEVFSSAGFHLRKWSSNCPEILQETSAEQQAPVDVKLAEHMGCTKALGIQWRPVEDSFSFKVNLGATEVSSKRQFLSDSSKLFDPFGWLAPVTISVKILFQQLWLYSTSWDDPLPPVIELTWNAIKDYLHQLEEIRIPRFAANFDGRVELHGFSDASEAACSAVVYTRATDEKGNIVVTLLAAKTKVAPLEQVSLPRLELNAAALLADLMERVVSAFEHLKVECWAWTDSTIVLQWLSALPRKWKTYVGNRTAAILKVLPRHCWNHVSSTENPADCASRGLSLKELVEHELWLQGPKWLRQDKETWKLLPAEIIEDAELLEERKVKTLHSTTIALRQNYETELELLERRSDYVLIVRALAYVNRYCLRLRTKTTFESTLTPEELYQADNQLARAAQHEAFKSEIDQLFKGNELSPKSKLSSLHPFIDGTGTLRVGGRLQNSSYPYDLKHPIILPRDHRFTELLLRTMHLRNLHAGAKLLTSTVNQRYWIVGLQNAIRRTVQSCTRCVRLKGRTAVQLMGSLPLSRVMATRAFSHVGVDFTGPLLLRAACVRGVKTTKGYIAVFVCMSTKAVHLEAASDLSTNTFISALKRFISRRGYPNEIWSDNGTNFLGTDRWLKELQAALETHNTQANRFLSNRCIRWVFNPPSAPHRGGIWEAAVKSVKKHIIAVAGPEAMTFEDLTTLLSQVEACLNSRPLCPLSTDPENCDALTPGHFLVGQPLNLLPEPGLKHVPVNRLDKWQLLHKKTTEIWNRWRDEYLASLQLRSKWRITEANLLRNQLVLVKNDNTPPAQWELARIMEVHPDSTGVVRTVTLRRGNAEYQRPIQKICVLPTD